MRRHPIVLACLLVGGCTNGDGAERPSEPAVPPIVVPTVEPESETKVKTWGWAVRAEADADRVIGLAVAGDGSTVLLTSGGLGWSGDDVALSRYDAAGELSFTRRLALRSGPDGRALALRGDDRIEVLDVAMRDAVPAVKIASHALADGSLLEERTYDGVGEFRPNELHALPDGDSIIAGYAVNMTAGAFQIRARHDHPQSFIARVAADGTTRWLRTLSNEVSTTRFRSVTAVSITPKHVLMTGDCSGASFGGHGRRVDCGESKSAYVARWSLDGDLEWLDAIRSHGGRPYEGGDVEARAIAPTPDDGWVIVGRFDAELRAGHGRHRVSLATRGSSDAFLAHYDRDGDLVGAWAAGDAGLDRFVDVAVDDEGDAWIAGIVYGHDALALDLAGKAARPPSKRDEAEPRFGTLVRVDLDRKAAASLPGRFVAAQGEFAGPGDGVTPERVVVVGDHVRLAGAYGGRIELPILDGSVASLDLRDPEGVDDEVFVWASQRRRPR